MVIHFRECSQFPINIPPGTLPKVKSIFFTVPYKCPKLTGVDVVMNGQKEAFVELERTGVLHHQLPHCLHELRENRGHFLIIGGV